MSFSHRERYLKQQQTEKIETEVRDVDRIQIMLSRVAFWGGVTQLLQST